MDAALFFEFLHPQTSPIPNPLKGKPKPESELFAECIEQVELADRVGFRYVWSVDHHIMAGHSHMPAPEVFFAAAAPRTKQIRFGTGVTVLPLAHPLMTAERIATLDHLTGGRVEFGTGRGGHRADYDAMEVPYKENRERWEESLDLILKAWSEDEFTFSGRFFHVTEPVTVVPKPLQKPHPPLWYATLGPKTPEFIGRKGLSLLTFSFFQALSDFTVGVQMFRQAARDAGHGKKLKIGAAIPVHVAETSKQARQDAEDLILWYMKSSIAIVAKGLHKERPENLRYLDKMFSSGLDKMTFDELIATNRIICGSPEDCIKQLKPYQDLGIDVLLGMFEFGGGENAKVLRAIDLFGKEVLPSLKRSSTVEQRKIA